MPWAALIWLVVSGLLLMISTQVVTLRDRQRFPGDFELLAQPAEGDNTVQLEIVAGTFEYNVVPEVSTEAAAGTYSPDTDDPVAAALFANIPDVTEVTVTPQTITIVYDNDFEPDLMVRRSERPIFNAVLNDQANITGEVAGDAENTLVFTTTDETWRYGRYVPTLIPEGTQEVYASRDEAQNGSALAQFLIEDATSIQALTLNPDSLVVTYRDGAVESQVINRVQDALNEFHPRASLEPNLWLFSIVGSPDTILEIVPIDTDVPLFIFTLAFAIIELLLFIFLRHTSDKLVRPLVRVAGVFLLFWSIYGHEPLWDYVLGSIFPTSNQLVHPNATVIEFTAQHLELVFVSSLITISAGLTFGVIVTRENFREILPLVNNLVNSGQTIPTIAIVAFMAPIIGFGFWPAIIALVAYGLLPVLRNTIAGLEAVDDFIIDSARGMGMTPSQILFQIELPIASSVIMAGIRTSMVINVGTATLGAFVGSGGLGTPITSGLSMTIDAFILLGAIPAALLAILIDYVLGRIEFVLTPRGLQIQN
ncbi:MAG: ABC transporter permease [Chloroflexi bacterium]|nr:ABC transporter permease [Chloroflexota bacterium]